MLLLLLWSCFDTIPQYISDPAEVPQNLKQAHCPKGSTLQDTNGIWFCKDRVSEKQNGPSLEKTKEGRVFRWYQQGEESRVPWILNISGEEDTEKIKNYLRQDLSLVLLQDAKKRFPTDKDITARLAEKGESSPDVLFPNRPLSCEEPPSDMMCIPGGGWVQRIYDNNAFHFRAFWANRFYVDSKLVSQQEVLDCQKSCLCPKGKWNEWNVAQAFCAKEGKRLLHENEIWMMYAKSSSAIEIPKNRGFELSRDDFIKGGDSFSVLWNPQGTCVEDCSGHVAVSTSQTRKSQEEASFRCGVSELDQIFVQGKPMRLHHLPVLDTPTENQRYSWASTRPKTMHTGISASLPKGYLNYQQVADTLWAYHAKYKEQTALYQIGKTHRGNPIIALYVGSSPIEEAKKPAILIEGAHHGNELLSILYVFQALDTLFSDTPRKTLDTYDFWFVPVVNPDGLSVKLYQNAKRQYGRKNGRDLDGVCSFSDTEGVDLNRNYPFKWGLKGNRSGKSDPKSAYFRGFRSASEPEVQAMMAFAKKQHFVASLSFSTPGTSILVPYTAYPSKNPQPYIAWEIGKRLQEKAGTLYNDRSFRIRNRRFYADGVFHDWLFHRFGTLAFQIEGTEDNPDSRSKIRDSVRATRTLLPTLIDELEKRPVLTGFVVDAKGNPLTASVEVRGYDVREGEVWKSRSRDGFFHRVLFDDGSYEVIVHADGYETLHQECIVGQAEKPCTIVLRSVMD